MDPEVKKCPECYKPNQFGEMCPGCEVEFNRVQACEEAFNERNGLYEYGE